MPSHSLQHCYLLTVPSSAPSSWPSLQPAIVHSSHPHPLPPPSAVPARLRLDLPVRGSSRLLPASQPQPRQAYALVPASSHSVQDPGPHSHCCLSTGPQHPVRIIFSLQKQNQERMCTPCAHQSLANPSLCSHRDTCGHLHCGPRTRPLVRSPPALELAGLSSLWAAPAPCPKPTAFHAGVHSDTAEVSFLLLPLPSALHTPRPAPPQQRGPPQLSCLLLGCLLTLPFLSPQHCPPTAPPHTALSLPRDSDSPTPDPAVASSPR